MNRPESSDLPATQDQAVAVEFIREHACDRIKVADVARGVGLSPTALETRMRRVIGRTVYQEIQRVQIDAVRELLGETDLPLKQIVRRCGFKYTQFLSRVFRQSTGRTLTEYRKQMRLVVNQRTRWITALIAERFSRAGSRRGA